MFSFAMSDANASAVLTGDLIASRAAPAGRVDDAMAALRDAAQAFGRRHDLDLRFTRSRGDSWQVLVADAGLALDAALVLLARLRAADTGIATRLAAGIGTVTDRGTSDLSDADGPAFVASGDALEAMSRRHDLTIAGDGVGPMEVAVVALCEAQVRRWTAAQAEAAALALLDPRATQDDLARLLNITRQAVQNRLSGAGVAALDLATTAFRHRFGSGGAVP